MSALLTAAAVMALAIRPDCGAAPPGSDLARQLVATAQAESSMDPFVIHVNGSDGGYAKHYATEVDAIVAALELEAGHISYDLGLMQINNKNLARHGLTLHIGSAFDPCTNMRAGTDHLVDDVHAVLNLASRRYNCGRIDCGEAYARRVDALVAQPGDPARSGLPSGAEAARRRPTLDPPPGSIFVSPSSAALMATTSLQQ